jgi:ubiquinone/menaquinone biosynthesis C-methylase UbiE
MKNSAGNLVIDNAFDDGLITHYLGHIDFKLRLEQIKQNIINTSSNTDYSKYEKLKVLDELISFPLGRFLVENRGLDAKWSDYITRPEYNIANKNSLKSLEQSILFEFPIFKAMQENLKICQQIIQKNLFENIKIASLACGVMADILTLDYSKISKVNITGIDLDYESIILAHKLSQKHKLELETQFIQADAWKINFTQEYHLVVSNSINNYISNQDKMINLYTKIHKSLKDGGLLISNFQTASPFIDEKSTWNMNLIDPSIINKQMLILDELVKVRFNNFKTLDEIANILEKSGFREIEFIFDTLKVMPLIIAKK